MPPAQTLAQQSRMVAALQASLQRQLASHAAGAAVERIETHISFVLVAGEFAYKFKKAVSLGFLDFTTLAQRQHDCLDELRLNRRLAAPLYLDVLPVTGTPDAPQIGGAGEPIDWLLRMRAFDQAGLWDRMTARSALHGAHVDALAAQLHAFHRDAAVADAHSHHGQPEQIRAPMRDNLRTLGEVLKAPADRARLHALQAWEARTFAALEAVFEQHRRAGRIRECHGDLHLGNVVQIGDQPVAFDCIEFSDELRWIDVMSEIAFMAMDLRHHGRADLAHRFVNACLEHGGDYAGLRVLRYYEAYRALVRAKVTALRVAQQAGADAQAVAHAVRPYLDLAEPGEPTSAPALMVTHGCSGSGKTTLTRSLIEASGAIRIRADVERKRLFGLDATARSSTALDTTPGPALYTADATEATYVRLLELAAEVLAGGRSVVLDATFLRRRHRDQARQWAAQHGVRFVILDFAADPAVLLERVRQRAARGNDASDADEAVLAAQLRSAEALAADELPDVFRCPPARNTAFSTDQGEIAADWSALLQRLAVGAAAGG